MLVNTENLVPITEADKNFSSVIRVVEERGMAVILKNDTPKYVLVSFDEYDEIQAFRKERAKKISDEVDNIIEENLEAFMELAK
ncbi:MAG: prevent-host-death protein [Epulopiscium sp. Nele67-Bin004]|nr:MAG: prevent-host-death protein [Epulopiscium sp. Nele67-Bin004]